MSIRGTLRDVAIDLDDAWDDLRLKLLRSLGGPGPLRILSYRGIGRPDRLLLRRRVLVDRGPTEYESDDDFWDDLVNMYRRLHTTEIPKARVRVSAVGAAAEVVTDHEGYFEVELEAADRPFSPPLQAVDLELLEPSGDEPVVEQGEVVVRGAGSQGVLAAAGRIAPWGPAPRADLTRSWSFAEVQKPKPSLPKPSKIVRKERPGASTPMPLGP